MIPIPDRGVAILYYALAHGNYLAWTDGMGEQTARNFVSVAALRRQPAGSWRGNRWCYRGRSADIDPAGYRSIAVA
jgi:hypothetical protein